MRLVPLVPHYLTIQDLVRLSAVSRRYREVFDLSSTSANYHPLKQILASLLQREAVHTSNDSTSRFKISDQLPSIGNLSVAESLQQDPLTVAKLRKAALKRRKLVRIEERAHTVAGGNKTTVLDITPWPMALNTLLNRFRPSMISEMIHNLQDLGIGTRFTSLQDKTKFICVNRSGVDLYCHWIEYGGSLRIEAGDYIPSHTTIDGSGAHTSDAAPPPPVASFVVEHNSRDNTWSQPPHIFNHSTMSTHAFALCYQQGGPPFAIYQCRRSWHAWRGLTKHVHAIVVLPGGHIRELHCDASRNGATNSIRYRIYDRATGNAMSVPEEPVATRTVRSVPDHPNASGVPTIALAEKFYGVDIPDFKSVEEDEGGGGGLSLWRQGSDEVQNYMGRANQPLNFPMVLSEAFYRNVND